MSEYKITLIGLETRLNYEDDSLFKNMSLPSGIDKELLKNNILMRSGEFEVLYADPFLNQSLISIWSRKYYPTFERWVKALNIEYNPLENFNRHETITDNTGEKEKGSSKSDMSGTDSNDTTVTYDTTVTAEVTYDSKVETDDITDVDEAAFNESTPSAKTKTTLDGEVNRSGSDTTETTTSGDDTTESSGTLSRSTTGSNEVNKDIKYTRDAHLYGNIGVTTSQQMLNAELDIGYWNLIDRITDLFLREFVLLVY